MCDFQCLRGQSLINVGDSRYLNSLKPVCAAVLELGER